MKWQRLHPGGKALPTHGFTLVELLIAMGILLLLASFLLVGMGGILGGAKKTATQTTLKKISEILRQQQAEFNVAMSSTPPKRAQEPCLGLDADAGLRSLLERKRLFREAFPQRAADLRDANGNFTRMGVLVNAKLTEIYIAKNGSSPSTAQLDAARDVALGSHGSSELLFLILTEGTAYGTSVLDSDQFSSREARDTDGDGLLELIDAWEQPLLFYRWPTRMIRPCDPDAPTVPLSTDPVRVNLPAVDTTYWKLLSSSNVDIGVLGRDGEDPLSSLYRLVGGSISGVQSVESNANPTCNFHTPDTYAPLLVVSMGPDLAAGLYLPNDTANFGHLAQPSVAPNVAADSALNDNITNLQGIE